MATPTPVVTTARGNGHRVGAVGHAGGEALYITENLAGETLDTSHNRSREG